MKRYILIILVFISGLLIGWFLKVFDNIDSPTYTKQIIYSIDNNSKIVLKKKYWGFDKMEIVISKDFDDFSYPDYKNDFVLKGLHNIFYRFDNDTLTVFTRIKFSEPTKFESKIKIKQIELDNASFETLRQKINKQLQSL